MASTSGLTLREIAEAVGGTVQGLDDTIIAGAASVRDAAQGDIVLAENAKYLAEAEKSQASAVVASDGAGLTKPVVVVDNPRRAFNEILDLLAPEVSHPSPGVDPNCRMGARVVVGEGAAVSYGCFIGDDVVIGNGAVIYPFVYLGDGVKVGAGSVLFPNVVVYRGCEIGNRVRIHGGSVIGADGFGYIGVGNELRKVPHIGNVVIEDDVEIGACVTVDRAKTGSTRVGSGTKIDNQVQVAHNCRIGRMCLLAGQIGMAGSSSLGDGVMLGGQAGVRDHVHVGDGAMIAARAGVISDVPAGKTYSGYPARPHREAQRVELLTYRLPEITKIVDGFQKELQDLKAQLARLTGGE